MISEGFKTDAIAKKLFISPYTVKKHRGNILKKSNCKNMTELIRNSIIYGLV
ncbi:response regulator transcription factor [Flavobacterium sp. 3HN19-14]|uniref:response regulator transcription factor n=1 Tax=Flavobacterium sp. 3HN19-14 TaxID=3448133 RepID=UPI003EE2E22F